MSNIFQSSLHLPLVCADFVVIVASRGVDSERGSSRRYSKRVQVSVVLTTVVAFCMSLLLYGWSLGA